MNSNGTCPNCRNLYGGIHCPRCAFDVRVSGDIYNKAAGPESSHEFWIKNGLPIAAVSHRDDVRMFITNGSLRHRL